MKGQQELDRLFRGSGVDALRIETGSLGGGRSLDDEMLGYARQLASFFDRRRERRVR